MTTGPSPEQPDIQKSPEELALIDQLLREAKAAIKMGDKDSARAKLQDVVSIDQYNEQGWYWLAAVVETDDERRVCLGNVVVINPNNERAQRMLDQLSGNPNAGLLLADENSSANMFQSASESPVVSSLLKDRRVLIGAGAGVIVLLLILVFAFRPAPAPVPTLVPTIAAANNSTASGATIVVKATVTQLVIPDQPTLPPTWTPSPAPIQPQPGSASAPTPPPGLTGHLIGISGSLIVAKGNMPIVIMNPYGNDIQAVSGNDVGDDGILTSDGLRVVYSRYIGSTDSRQLRLMNANGSQPTELSRLWNNNPPLTDPRYPAIARNAPIMVFSAASIAQNDATPDIWMVAIDQFGAFTTGAAGPAQPGVAVAPPPPGSGPNVPIQRITAKDSGNNTAPTIAPDGGRIVYVSDLKPLGQDGVDLFMIVPNNAPQNLTNDLNETIEDAPEFSPDGTRIAYQGLAKGERVNSIYVMNADGTNKMKIVEGGNNIRPHWSPDGRFIAFSSNRNSRWEIYVVEVETKNVYQVTNIKSQTICTGWGTQ